MIPYLDGTTTAIWSWRTDNGNFVPYSNKVNVDLEMNYLQGAKTFDVDKLRYVNFKKPFQQYRKPFKTNGRDVTREVPGSFFNNVLVLLTEDQSLKNKYIEEVNARGGIVTDYITPVVWIYVCTSILLFIGFRLLMSLLINWMSRNFNLSLRRPWTSVYMY